MTNAAHTPGPWEAHQGIDLFAPSLWDVTSKHDWSGGNGATPQGWFVATVHEVTDEASAEANARLIAAAPELLYALENLLAVKNGEGGTMFDSDEIARAAIAKARGQA